MLQLRIVLLVILSIICAACTSEPYKAPVTAFSEAVTKSQKSLTTLNQDIANKVKEINKTLALNISIKLSKRGCDLGDPKKRCEILLQATNSDGNPVDNPWSLDPHVNLGQLEGLMGDLQAYATSLSDLINADTIDKVNNSVTAALGDIQKLAKNKDVAKQFGDGKPSSTDFSTPVSAAINWVVGQYVEFVKFDALKDAVKQAQPKIVAIGKFLKSAEAFSQMANDAELVEEVRASYSQAVMHRTKDNVDALEAAVNKLNQFRSASHTSVFASLVTAHTGLYNRLCARQKTSWSDVMDGMARFKAQADQLAGVVQGLIALHNAKPGS